MATTDEVLELVRLSRDRTVALSDAQIVAMTTAWVNVWDELEPEFSDALTTVLSGQAGNTVPASQLQRSQRLTQALQQARERLGTLFVEAGDLVVNDLSTVMLSAAAAHIATLQAQLPNDAPGIRFGRVRADEIDAMVARTTQQIHAATQPLPAHVESRMKAELVRATVVGDNPNTTARRIVKRTGDEFYGGLTRATRISRVEILDSHRAADLLAAQKNRHISESKVWMASLDGRTCSSCLAQHGTEWPLDAPGPDDHHNGRCVFITKTKSWDELGFTGIEDTGIDLTSQRDAWWENLTEDTQRHILGPGRYELWQSGEIGWSDLSKHVDNDNWRPSYVATPLKDLV